MERAAPRFPIWPCTRWGFPCRVACASRGALLPHLFTITAGLRRRLFHFLWHFPSASLETGRLRVSQPNKPGLRSIAPCGVRTFLPQLTPGAILRPSKTAISIVCFQKNSTRVDGHAKAITLEFVLWQSPRKKPLMSSDANINPNPIPSPLRGERGQTMSALAIHLAAPSPPHLPRIR